MADKLIAELQKIGEYTGLTIDNLYKMLEKEAQVYFVYDILGIICCISFLIIFILVEKYSAKKLKEDESENGFLETVRALNSILILITFFVSVLLIPNMIADMIHIKMNTAGWILQHLTDLIK